MELNQLRAIKISIEKQTTILYLYHRLGDQTSKVWCYVPSALKRLLRHSRNLFSLIKPIFFCECDHLIIDKPMVITKPVVASARLLGLG